MTHAQSSISLPLLVVNFDNELVSSIPRIPVSTHQESPILLHPEIGSPALISHILDSNPLNLTLDPLSTPPNVSNVVHPSSYIPVDLDFRPDNLQVISSVPSLNLHLMQTGSKNGIVKKNVLLTTVEDSRGIDLNLIEPSTYKSTLKVPIWMNAMKEELSALFKQGTWSLVSLPAHKNLVGCKWIFKIKKHADGSIARHKARLVAQGFSQETSLDYGETFSQVVKPTTVRLILSLTAQFDWPLR
ncbi:hypothetical protein ACFXTO_028267 [Malus domestica]